MNSEEVKNAIYEKINRNSDSFVEELIEAYDKSKICDEVLMECIRQNYGIEADIKKSDEEAVIKKGKDLISVIIPTYNRIQYIEKAIDSVLQQSYKRFEIIVIDDSSTDGTKELFRTKYAEERRVRYYSTKRFRNILPGYKRKIGYDKSRGDYLIFLDSDDYYLDQDFFAKVIEFYHTNPEYAMVGSNALVFNEDTGKYSFFNLNVHESKNAKVYLENFQTILKKPLSQFTTVFSRQKLEQADVKKVKMLEDSIIYMRALLSGDAYIMPDIIGAYRVHGGSWSTSINTEYLIGVLNEKLAIAHKAKQVYPDKDWNAWLYRQAKYTIGFVTKSSDTSIMNKIQINLWMLLFCRRLYITF